MDQQENMETKGVQEHNPDIEALPTSTVQAAIDPEIEKRVVRKLDRRVVPLVALLYLVAFLDRSNIGYVSIKH